MNPPKPVTQSGKQKEEGQKAAVRGKRSKG